MEIRKFSDNFWKKGCVDAKALYKKGSSPQVIFILMLKKTMNVNVNTGWSARISHTTYIIPFRNF